MSSKLSQDEALNTSACKLKHASLDKLKKKTQRLCALKYFYKQRLPLFSPCQNRRRYKKQHVVCQTSRSSSFWVCPDLFKCDFQEPFIPDGPSPEECGQWQSSSKGKVNSSEHPEPQIHRSCFPCSRLAESRRSIQRQ